MALGPDCLGGLEHVGLRHLFWGQFRSRLQRPLRTGTTTGRADGRGWLRCFLGWGCPRRDSRGGLSRAVRKWESKTDTGKQRRNRTKEDSMGERNTGPETSMVRYKRRT